MGEIWQDLGHRPLVFVRFNPDKYNDKDRNNTLSLWRTKKCGTFNVWLVLAHHCILWYTMSVLQRKTNKEDTRLDDKTNFEE